MGNIYKTFIKGFLKDQSVLKITSDFGKRHINGKIENHNGIDIGVPQGTVLLSPLSGKVIERKVQKNGAGLYVTIRHQVSIDKYIYIILMHLHSVESYINAGYYLNEGEKIGTTGGAVSDQPNAGYSTGPHLHLEVRNGGNSSGNAVDPKFYFLAKERLVCAKSGKILNYGDPEFKNFDESFLRTQSKYKYSSLSDITLFNQTEYTPDKKKQFNSTAKERLAPGIWQIVKLIVDSSVENKQVLDSGISTQQGSLLNFFRKVCQEPLVEFSGDTFGNQYYFYARRPPFDKEGLTKMIDLTSIEIDPSCVLNDSFSWNNQGIYSWYRYVPYADLLGISESTLFMPSVFFPEFASIWGSKPLCVESNYYNFNFSGRFNSDKVENKQNGDRIIRNAVADFKYLIESNAYNAFTRTGSITLIGDRRIKRGTVINYTPTGEIFYVESVTNNYDVSESGTVRTTTLQVSHGVYPAYVYGKKIGDKNISYFNIIDWGEGFDINSINSSNWKDFISKWKVNIDSFGFFLSKQQVYWENINVLKNS